ncbi:MAG: hypothetical protein CM1200mP27_11420 [Chloroflexota bacterium]|nr:MAG: hypothetical protein CM1200mP27_11420 [Chloroflexota bacterium]
MAKSWTDMVNEAKAAVQGVSPHKTQQGSKRSRSASNRSPDAESVPIKGSAPEVVMISLDPSRCGQIWK